jgi:hypothetical protein
MRLHVPRIGLDRWTDLRVDDLEELAASDRFRAHELVADPEAADAVLFVQCHMVDWRLRAIREHPVAVTYWDKVAVYDERDRPWLSFPGLYVSTPRSAFDIRRQRPWSYMRVQSLSTTVSPEPDLLFSFVGSPTAPCRGELFKLRHPDAVVEEVTDFMFWDGRSADFADRHRHYQDVLGRSRFVLCPRGRGTSSLRLYEALSAGRVPVVISDEWVAPPGPNWDAISLRVPEHRAQDLVDLIEERDEDWPAMSVAVSAAYREFFSEDVAFHRITDLVADLLESRPRRHGRRRMRGRALASAAQARWRHRA